jgi:hypothetical protein
MFQRIVNESRQESAHAFLIWPEKTTDCQNALYVIRNKQHTIAGVCVFAALNPLFGIERFFLSQEEVVHR